VQKRDQIPHYSQHHFFQQPYQEKLQNRDIIATGFCTFKPLFALGELFSRACMGEQMLMWPK
jgi:hypothetical protein